MTRALAFLARRHQQTVPMPAPLARAAPCRRLSGNARDISEASVERAYAAGRQYTTLYSARFRERRKASIAAAEKIGGRILDVGVGTGIFAPDYRRDIRLVGSIIPPHAEEGAGARSAAKAQERRSAS